MAEPKRRTITVTPKEKAAAMLRVKLAEQWGEEVDQATRAIANAKPMSRRRPASAG